MSSDIAEVPFEPDPRSAWLMPSPPEPKVKILGPCRSVDLPLDLWEHLGPDVQQTITEWATTRVPLKMDIIHETHDE